MTLTIDINSNMVHAINGRLLDMDVSVVWRTISRTDEWTNDTMMVVVLVTHAN